MKGLSSAQVRIHTLAAFTEPRLQQQYSDDGFSGSSASAGAQPSIYLQPLTNVAVRSCSVSVHLLFIYIVYTQTGDPDADVHESMHDEEELLMFLPVSFTEWTNQYLVICIA